MTSDDTAYPFPGTPQPHSAALIAHPRIGFHPADWVDATNLGERA